MKWSIVKFSIQWKYVTRSVNMEYIKNYIVVCIKEEDLTFFIKANKVFCTLQIEYKAKMAMKCLSISFYVEMFKKSGIYEEFSKIERKILRKKSKLSHACIFSGGTLEFRLYNLVLCSAIVDTQCILSKKIPPLLLIESFRSLIL